MSTVSADDRMVTMAGTGQTFTVADLEAALALACRAPSIHNTQPWSWFFDGTTLSLRADRSRQLRVADPDGHSLLISCGAALTLTEYALRASGWAFDLQRLPDPADRDLVARFSNPSQVVAGAVDLARAGATLRRRSDRRPFRSKELPGSAVESLRAAADAPGVHVHFPSRPDEKLDLAVAVSWADRQEANSADYLAEMRHWLRDGADRADGIPTSAVPHVSSGHPRHTDVPIRDFEAGIPGKELIEQDVDEHPLIAVVLSESDTDLDRLRSGEAMMRLMIEAELLGLSCCPLSQAVDLGAFRSRLQTLMGWIGHPQMMLRLGYPDDTIGLAALTPRRPVTAMLHLS